MKKNFFLSIAILTFTLLNIEAQIVQYPVNKILADSILEDVHTKLTANSALNITGNNTTVTVSGTTLLLSLADLAKIRNNGGTIQNYKLVIKAPTAFSAQTVNTTCPDRNNAFGTTLVYEYYFVNGNVYIDGGYMYAITVNYKDDILTGDEVISIAQQCVGLYGGVLSDYVLLVTDSEFTALQ